MGKNIDEQMEEEYSESDPDEQIEAKPKTKQTRRFEFTEKRRAAWEKAQEARRRNIQERKDAEIEAYLKRQEAKKKQKQNQKQQKQKQKQHINVVVSQHVNAPPRRRRRRTRAPRRVGGAPLVASSLPMRPTYGTKSALDKIAEALGDRLGIKKEEEPPLLGVSLGDVGRGAVRLGGHIGGGAASAVRGAASGAAWAARGTARAFGSLFGGGEHAGRTATVPTTPESAREVASVAMMTDPTEPLNLGTLYDLRVMPNEGELRELEEEMFNRMAEGQLRAFAPPRRLTPVTDPEPELDIAEFEWDAAPAQPVNPLQVPPPQEQVVNTLAASAGKGPSSPGHVPEREPRLTNETRQNQYTALKGIEKNSKYKPEKKKQLMSKYMLETGLYDRLKNWDRAPQGEEWAALTPKKQLEWIGAYLETEERGLVGTKFKPAVTENIGGYGMRRRKHGEGGGAAT